MRIINVLFKRFYFLVLSVILLGVLTGCSALDSAISSSPSALTGTFLDSPVDGLTYTTPTMNGTTNNGGKFSYQAGEKVTFSIGKVVLGSAVGKPVITPLDIVVGAKDTKDQRVVNICVLIQTLDEDGNLDNGILITPKVASYVDPKEEAINFDKSVRAFSFDAGLRSIISNLNEIDAFGQTPRAVRPPGLAQKHLETTISKLNK